MKKFKKSTITTIALVGLLGVGTIGGTLAYLTDAENTTNTFTVGKVQIDTLERNYPGNNSDEVSDITPNEVIPKDPTAKNTGKNNAVVMVAYDIPMAKTVTYAERAASTSPTKAVARTNHELFTTLLDGDAPDAVKANEDGSNVNTGWTIIKKVYVYNDIDPQTNVHVTKATDDGTAIAARYLVGYNKVLGIDQETNPVFSYVRLNNFVEGDIDSTTQDIVINTYAIQADNLTAGVEPTAGTDISGQLSDIYGKYITQNGEWMPSFNDADNSNGLDLKGNARTATDASHVNISLSVDDTKLYVGDVANAIATVDTDLDDTTYTLKSSDDNGLRVTKSGDGYKITAIKAGTYTITATSNAKAVNGQAATTSVAVSVIAEQKSASDSYHATTTYTKN